MTSMEFDTLIVKPMAETDRLARAGVARQPPAETIAVFVRLQRAMMGWKKDTLASFAGVSTATVERIERGVAVSLGCLERVAAALKQPLGAFTEARVPFTAEVAAEMLAEAAAPFDATVSVAVRPLTGHRQVAELAKAHFYLINADRLGDHADDEIAILQEWLDLVSFVLSTEDGDPFVTSDGQARAPRRKLYESVLTHVRAIEHRHHAVALAGTYQAVTGLPDMPTATVAVLAFFPRLSDPAASKRHTLFAPSRVEMGWPPE